MTVIARMNLDPEKSGTTEKGAGNGEERFLEEIRIIDMKELEQMIVTMMIWKRSIHKEEKTFRIREKRNREEEIGAKEEVILRGDGESIQILDPKKINRDELRLLAMVW